MRSSARCGSLLATTSFGTRSLARVARVDVTRPVVRFISMRNVNGVNRLNFSSSEAVHLKIWYGTNRWDDGDMVEVDKPAGVKAHWRRIRARRATSSPRLFRGA